MQVENNSIGATVVEFRMPITKHMRYESFNKVNV
jgi:hypothetical protein